MVLNVLVAKENRQIHQLEDSQHLCKRKINEHASQISILFRSSYHLKDVEALGGVPEEARVEEVEEAHSP